MEYQKEYKCTKTECLWYAEAGIHAVSTGFVFVSG